MDGDVFTSSKKNDTKEKLSYDNNFFVKTELSSKLRLPHLQSKHLNDYDFNILKNDAYKDLEDDLFKIEYRISVLENDLSSLDTQIQAAIDINDIETAKVLNQRKVVLNEDLKTLMEIYNDTSLSAKISGGFASKFKNNFLNMKKQINNLTDALISKLPGKLSAFSDLKSSLAKLENINKSVDDLISRQIPYGEELDKYEQLSKYIIKANSIQSEIHKFWRS